MVAERWDGATALVVVDVQQGFDDTAYWGARNNPDCEANIARLLEAWRDYGWPVVYVRHDSRDPHSPLAPGRPGNAFKEVLAGEPDLLVTKDVHSAFHGTPDLDGWLRRMDVSGVAVCGIQTNVCCETTARVACDLGYDVLFVVDATHTFDIVASNHKVYRAREVARYSALTIDGEFGRVVYTDELVG
ncbi:MAG TPA: cysteine hydrolase [Actinobacteria bacterium]|nr:cysteine hydrolase [Actinomycetota bacterium]